MVLHKTGSNFWRLLFSSLAVFIEDFKSSWYRDKFVHIHLIDVDRVNYHFIWLQMIYGKQNFRSVGYRCISDEMLLVNTNLLVLIRNFINLSPSYIWYWVPRLRRLIVAGWGAQHGDEPVKRLLRQPGKFSAVTPAVAVMLSADCRCVAWLLIGFLRIDESRWWGDKNEARVTKKSYAIIHKEPHSTNNYECLVMIAHSIESQSNNILNRLVKRWLSARYAHKHMNDRKRTKMQLNKQSTF
jgi:hypothetical protein